MAEHIDLESLVAWWLADAPAAEDEELEAHLFACARCAERLEWLSALGEGVRAAVRGGRVGLFVSGGFVEALSRAGLRLREYKLEPGASVNCTILADDDAVVSRIRAPLAGVRRVDALKRVSTGGVEAPEARIADVPFDPAAGELFFMPGAAALKAMPSHTLRVRLVAVGEGGERPLGDYTFLHTAAQ